MTGDFTYENLDKLDWLEDFKKNGYTVVKNVLSPEKASEYESKVMDWLESFPLGFDRNNRDTWIQDHMPINNVGVMNRYSANHEAFLWEIRQEQPILNVFEKIWGTDKLLVSFDAFNVYLPHGKAPVTQPWPHRDQNPYRNGYELTQGIMNLVENGPNDGGLVVTKGSHLLHEQYFAENGVNDAQSYGRPNSYKYTMDQLQWYLDHGCEVVKVCAGPGDLILWDSRTVHWNQSPSGDRKRICAYVCYQPRDQVPQNSINEKLLYFENRIGTTHWPGRDFFNGQLHSTTLRNGKPDFAWRTRPYKEPVITPKLRLLAGYDEYPN